jgi:hypothetical protein
MIRMHDQTGMRARRWLVLWAPIFLVACGGNGCTSCSVQTKAPVTPNALVLPETLKLRITQHGFDVVSQEIKPLMLAVLGQNQNGQAVLDISQLLGPIALNLNGGLGLFKSSASLRQLVLTLDVNAMQLTLVDPSDPAKLRLTLDHAQIGVVSGVIAGDASFAGINSNAACQVKNGIDFGKPNAHLATLSTTLDLVLGVDANGQLKADAKLISVDLHDLGFGLDKDCNLPECTDQVLLEDPCLECNLCLAGNLAGDAAQSLTALLEPVLGQVLVVLGNAIGKQLVLKMLNGKPLDIELPLDVAQLSGKLGPLGAMLGPAETIYLRGKPSPHAFTVHDQGLDATLDGALYAPANPCVIDAGEDATTVFAQLVQTPPPALPLTMLQPVPGAAGVSKTVDVGLLLSRSVVEEGLWSLLRSGLFCAGIDSRQLWSLSAGKLVLSADAVDLFMPGVRQLAGLPADHAPAPVRISILPSANPNDAPRTQLQHLGTGGVRLHAQLRRMAIGLEVAVRGRWLTVLEARADVDVTARVSTPAGKLAIAVEHVDLTALQVDADSLFPHARVAEIIPAVVHAAVGVLLAQPLEFDLDAAGLITQALGLPLQAELIGLDALGDSASQSGEDWLALGLGLKAGVKP